MPNVGVDGCPGGWLAVALSPDGAPSAQVFASFDELWQAHGEAERVLADVPIGLREDSGEPRPCDAEARQLLGYPRSTSVFEPPVRAALDAETYAEARAINEARAGKSIPAPSWGIAAKIREVDAFLRGHPEALDVVREAHPEVCLWALNGRRAMEHSKTREPQAAFRERADVLGQARPRAPAELGELDSSLDARVGLDDLVDAYVLALSAGPWTGRLQRLPSDDDAEREDPRGLPMEIWYAEKG